MPTEPGGRAAPSLRFRLLLTVNLVLAAVLSALMAVDYALESERFQRDRHTELHAEADATVAALQRLGHHGPEAIQQYLDDACARLAARSSSGHHISAKVGGADYHAQAHGEDGSARGAEPIVACEEAGGVRVCVTELARPLVQEARRRALWRLPALLIPGILVSGVVNLILLKLVTRPMRELAEHVRQIGQGRLDDGERAAGRSYGNREMNTMAREIAAMSHALARVEADRRKAMDKARRIQENIRPVMPRDDRLSFAARYRPADEVGGDYYDVRAAHDGSLVLCVADVTGHGVPAALGAAILKVLFVAAVARTSEPSEILAAVHEGFASASLYEDFATMAVAVVTPDYAELRFASAGHEPCYLVDASGATRTLEATGPLLGISDLAGGAADWAVQRLRVEPGSRLILLTDGLAEAASPGGQLLGRDALRTIASGLREDPIERVAKAIMDGVLEWTAGAAPCDDLTILAIEWRAPGA